MGVPGFTAEASLWERKYSYRALLGSNGLRSNSVLPQQGFAHLPFGHIPGCSLQALLCWANGGSVYSCLSPPCYQCCYFIN
jgi:hypothetical protein